MAGFGVGQLVQVIDPRNLAYGRIAMVMTTKKLGRSQVRFADLPKGVAASPDPTGFVNVFDDDELAAIDLPIAPCYALVSIKERNGEQEYSQYCLLHGASEQAIGEIAQEVARTWYDSEGDWDEAMQAYWTDFGASVAVQDWKIISLGRYAQLIEVVSDHTPANRS